jgi:hypothetical protein
MNVLRQSTAVDIGIGPFIDDDGITPATGLSITQAETRLKKNNGAWGQASDATTAVHEEEGWYEKELDATDTNTVGILIVAVYIAGNLAYWTEFQVVEEAVYDALYAAGATGALPVSTGGIVAASFGAGAIDAAAIADNAIDAGAIASNAITAAKIASDAITAAKIADGAIDAATFAAGAITAAVIATNAIDADALAADAIAEINATVDVALADYDGPTNAEMVARTLAAADYATAANLATVDTVVDAILVDTDVIGTPFNATVSADLLQINTNVGVTHAAVVTVDTVVDSILVDTAEIGAAGAGLTAVPWNASWDTEVQSEVTDALEVTLADSIPADGTAPSVKQALYMLVQFLTEREVTSTTCTVKKPNGSTTLFTLTLNDAVTPTSITRTS